MIEVISKTTHVARKCHHDSAADWLYIDLRDIISSTKMSFTELRAIAELKENNWKIIPGQAYDRYTIKEDGKLYTFKCLTAINAICIKYDIYCYQEKEY